MTSTTAEFLEGVPVAEILSSDAAAPFFSAFNKENPENATCFHCPSPGPQWASKHHLIFQIYNIYFFYSLKIMFPPQAFLMEFCFAWSAAGRTVALEFTSLLFEA